MEEYRLGEFVELKREWGGYRAGEYLQFAGISHLSVWLVDLYDPYLCHVITVYIFDIKSCEQITVY